MNGDNGDKIDTLVDYCPNCGAICGPADIISIDGGSLCVYYCPTCRGASWEVPWWAPTPRAEDDQKNIKP